MSWFSTKVPISRVSAPSACSRSRTSEICGGQGGMRADVRVSKVPRRGAVHSVRAPAQAQPIWESMVNFFGNSHLVAACRAVSVGGLRSKACHGATAHTRGVNKRMSCTWLCAMLANGMRGHATRLLHHWAGGLSTHL